MPGSNKSFGLPVKIGTTIVLLLFLGGSIQARGIE